MVVLLNVRLLRVEERDRETKRQRERGKETERQRERQRNSDLWKQFL